MTDLTVLISAVIDSCIDNGKKKVIKCGSSSARLTVQRLLGVSRSIEKALKLDPSKYSIAVSYGNGYFPKVPWIGITSKGKKVSNSPSVTMCFSPIGLGFVCGAMFYKRKKKGMFLTSKRDGNFIGLEGGSTKSDYTNRYFNPRDFYTNNIQAEELLSHIKSSIKLMDEILGSNDLAF